MYREHVFWFLVVVIGLCESLELNISGCVKDCSDQMRKGYRSVCYMRCEEYSIGKLVKKDYERTLPKPAAPRLVEAGWQTIQLRFNTTELERYSNLHYILEVKPQCVPQERNNLFVVFPYTRKYHNANQTTCTVKDLEPNTGYKFRVIAIKLNNSSPYSNWSNLINTTKTCRKLPCVATNIRLELRTRKPYQKDEALNSKFHWKPDTTLFSERNKTQLKYIIIQDLTSMTKNGECYPGERPDKKSSSAITSNSSDENQQVYYDCWYKLKMTEADDIFWTDIVVAERNIIFHVPKCIRINDDEICGCPPYKPTNPIDKVSIDARFTRDTPNNSHVTMFVTWNDVTWKNAENITYFKVQRRKGESVTEYYVNASSNVYQYNKTIPNLTYGMNYLLTIFGYHGHHCLFRDVEKLEFTAKPACENSNCSTVKPKSICEPSGYHGEYNCICGDEFSDEGNKCKETGDDPVPDDRNGVIVAAVLTPSLVILIAICIIVWLRKRHEKRMDFMEREMAVAFDFGSRNNPQRFIDQVTLEDDNSERVENLIYVSQDYVYDIPGYIAEKVCSFEMSASSIRFSGIIGRGEFGKVYVGEALGVNRNPEWTTVAIKTLTGLEYASEEELSDILREIELMKDLGKHENVIQMFGCCIRCRPICLILEYAPGGNLKNYLRSIKKKCKDIASAPTDEVTKSGKGRYQKLIGAGEIPKDSTPSTLVNASERSKLEETGIKKAEDLNFAIAARINEEIRVALDPKELESFARQIATGMKHVSGLSIVHRDLAARNILLGEDKVLKISDFGLSREGTYIKNSNGKIPFRWLSIEAIQERTYSTAGDVWAFGVVLWEICTLGDTPYSSVSDRDLKDFLLAGKRLEKVDSCTDDIYEIMLKCWSHLPKDRPTFTELSDKLWDLEHKEKPYVNLDSLMRQSIESEDGEEEDDLLNQVTNDYDDGCEEQLFWNGIPNNEVSDNKGFGDSRDDVNANVQQEQSVSTNVQTC